MNSVPSSPCPLSKYKRILGKKIGSVKKLVKRAKSIKNIEREPSQQKYYSLREKIDQADEEGTSPHTTPTGNFAVYVGEDRQRFVVPTSYLSHPLFKMLFEKAYNEFGFDQRNGLVVPCSVTTFQEVVNAVECCNSKFDFGESVQDFI